MAYEAVPIDVEIQKLTAAERDALSRYKTHENINTLLANETTPKLIAGLALLVSAPTILKIIFDALAKQTSKIPDGKIIKEAGVDYFTFTKDFGEAILDLGGPAIGGPFFEGEAEDFWKKYVKR
jgi:hypothetical protein